MSLSIDNIVLYEKNNRPLKVKFISDNTSYIKCITGTGREINILKNEYNYCNIYPSGRNYQIRLYNNENNYKRLHGFLKKDIDNIISSIKNILSIDVEQRDVSTKGWNWGKMEFNEKALSFVSTDSTKVNFDLPFNDISQSNVQGRNIVLYINLLLILLYQIALELLQDENVANEEECLTEIRFSLPMLEDTPDDEMPVVLNYLHYFNLILGI